MTDQQSSLELTFLHNFSFEEYELFEVTDEILHKLQTNNNFKLQIKGLRDSEAGTQANAALCSDSDTYRVKKSGNSNNVFVFDYSSGDIVKQTNYLIELQKTNTKIYQLSHLLMQSHALNEITLEDHSYTPISQQDLSQQTQVSEGELNSILQDPEQCLLLSIAEVGPQQYVYCEQSLLHELVDSLIKLLNQILGSHDQEFSIDYILSSDQRSIVKAKYLQHDRLIHFALLVISNFESEQKRYKLDQTKILKHLALHLLAHKPEYILNEFVMTLKNAAELAIPGYDFKNQSLGQELTSIYESFSDCDLSYLRGEAVLVPKEHQNVAVSQSTVIKRLNKYQSPEFEGCHEQVLQRISKLFEIKTKWTRDELELFLRDFVDENHQKFQSFLNQNFRTQSVASPFDKQKQLLLYIKKF